MSSRIYLDHAATSFPKAPGVAEAVARFLERDAGNPGRGGHRLSVAASRTVEECREHVARLLGGHPDRTLLGPGATFWLNTLIQGLLGPGDRVVTSSLEHNSVMRPLRFLERARGVEVRVVRGAHPSGVPAPEEIAAAVAEAPTRLVVLTHASNVSGAVLPVEAVARAVAPVPVVVDGAQAAGSFPFRFEGSGLAAYACSGHKGLLGPPGTGIVLLSAELAAALPPLVRGGTGSRSESEEMPDWLPDRLEAGTPNAPGFAGLAAAARWLLEEGVERIHGREQELARRLADGLSGIPRVRLHGRAKGQPGLGIVSFTVDGLDNGVLAAWLDRERGIMVRVGLHCAPSAHRRLATFPAGTLRAGIGPFTTAAHVDALAAAVEEAAGSGSLSP